MKLTIVCGLASLYLLYEGLAPGGLVYLILAGCYAFNAIFSFSIWRMERREAALRRSR